MTRTCPVSLSLRTVLIAAAIATSWSAGWCQVAIPPEPEEEQPKPNHLSLFVGARHEQLDEKEPGLPSEFADRITLTDLTIGLNFEYLGRDNVGVALFGQRTGGEADSWLVGAGMNIHGGRHFYFQFASVYEWRKDDGEGSIRAGLASEYAIGKKRRGTITPSFSIDFSSDRIVLWGGLAFGRRF